MAQTWRRSRPCAECARTFRTDDPSARAAGNRRRDRAAHCAKLTTCYWSGATTCRCLRSERPHREVRRGQCLVGAGEGLLDLRFAQEFEDKDGNDAVERRALGRKVGVTVRLGNFRMVRPERDRFRHKPTVVELRSMPTYRASSGSCSARKRSANLPVPQPTSRTDRAFGKSLLRMSFSWTAIS